MNKIKNLFNKNKNNSDDEEPLPQAKSSKSTVNKQEKSKK